MINVIGGKYRSRVLLTPPSSTTLPTKNMVRGAIFSALGNLNGAIVLDLFAGSGALGIEALSRGAKEAIFVELDKVAAKVVKDNLDKLKEENGRVLQMREKTIRFAPSRSALRQQGNLPACHRFRFGKRYVNKGGQNHRRI